MKRESDSKSQGYVKSFNRTECETTEKMFDQQNIKYTNKI